MAQNNSTNGIEQTNGHAVETGSGMLAGLDLQKTYGRPTRR